MTMALVRIKLGDTESEQGKRQELEGILSRGSVGDGRKQLILCAGLLIRLGVKSTNGAFDWGQSQRGCQKKVLAGCSLPLNMSLRFSLKMQVRGLRSWLLRKLATARACGVGGPGWTG